MAITTYIWTTAVDPFLMNNTITAGAEAAPAITGLQNGNYFCVWDVPQATLNVEGRVLQGNGTQVAGEFAVNSTTANNQFDASVATLLNGNAVAVFTDTSVDAGGDIRARLFTPTGTAVSGDFGVDTGTGDDTDADVAALADGGFVVSYTRDVGGGDFDLRSAIFNADGSARGSVIPVDSSALLNTNSSSVTGLTNGNFVVAWEQQPMAGGDTEVFYRIYNSTGTAVTAATLIDTAGTINQDIQIAALQDGGFAAAYVDNGWAISGTEITLRIFNADGSVRTGDLLPNTNTPGDQDKPSLTVLENGYIVVGWNDAGTETYQAYTPAGDKIGNNVGAFGANVEGEIASLGAGLVASVRSSTVTDAGGDQSIQSSVAELSRAINGDGTSETLTGDSLRDAIFGNGGNDTLVGGNGTDTLNGGDGNDTLYAGSGLWTDVLTGGTGDDTYELYNVASQVNENAGEGYDTVRSYAWATTLWDNVEDLQLVDPSSNTDGTGNALANILRGNAGSNHLNGLDGNDILIGNAGNDTLDGGNGQDTINGGDGNDTLLAGSGLWTDVLVGAAGDDTYEIYNVASQIYENAGEGYDTLRSYAWATTLPDNVEDLQLVDPSSNTDGTGNALANILRGNAGSNHLNGLDGNDILIGNAGNDTMDGGNGQDTINGGDGNDTLLAGSGLWTDVLVGAAGDDTYEIYNVASPIYENAGEGYDTLRSYAWATTLPDNVEDLQLVDPSSNTDGTGNALANILRGNAGSNHLNGLDGNDILIGNAGNDTLDGGNGQDTINGGDGNDTLLAGSGLWTDVLVGAAGDDTYEIYNVASQIYENAGEGIDTLRSYAWATTLPANVENLLLVDTVSNVDGTGNALNNSITGNAGNNVLSGLEGSDTLTGGAGADTFVLRPGDGGSALGLADVITDYHDGTDSIGLGGGLTYAGLTIQQGTGAHVNDTIIQRTATGEYLAVVQNVNASVFDMLDFKVVA